MQEFIQLPKKLAQIAFGLMTMLLVSVIMLYLFAYQPFIQDYLASYTETPETAVAALRDVLLPFGIMLFIPWLLNLLGILYIRRYMIASAIMLIVSGLMMLYTVIIPILLVMAGTMLIMRHRHYARHEKFETPYH